MIKRNYLLSNSLKNTLTHFFIFVIAFLLNFKMSPERGPGPGQSCLKPAARVWVLGLVQEEFHNTSPGNFESRFIKLRLPVKQGWD